MIIKIAGGTLEKYQTLIKKLIPYGFKEGAWNYDKWLESTNKISLEIDIKKGNFPYLLISGYYVSIYTVNHSTYDKLYHFTEPDALIKYILFDYNIPLNVTKKEFQKETMEVYRTFDFKNRKITLCVTANPIKVGYSVKVKEDEENSELGRKIALGRALNSKTNIMKDFADLVIDTTDLKKAKSTLHTIALGFQKRIETGGYQIKGIKE